LREGGELVGEVSDANGKGKFRQIMTNKSVHFLAFFVLFYVGVEVTIGGESSHQVKTRGRAKSPQDGLLRISSIFAREVLLPATYLPGSSAVCTSSLL
jgi:hypothetical protein